MTAQAASNPPASATAAATAVFVARVPIAGGRVQYPLDVLPVGHPISIQFRSRWLIANLFFELLKAVTGPLQRRKTGDDRAIMEDMKPSVVGDIGGVLLDSEADVRKGEPEKGIAQRQEAASR